MIESYTGNFRIADLLKGWNFPPRLVALVRGGVAAAILAGLAYFGANAEELASFLPSLPEVSGQAATTGGIILWIIRYLEGEADQKIDPMQNRTAEARAANPPQ